MKFQVIYGVCLLQEDNGMPVHLKGGSADALLYRTTMALTVLGEKTLLCFKLIFPVFFLKVKVKLLVQTLETYSELVQFLR